jgi:serine/threonine protein kinase
MAPELALSQRYDAQVDIFSFGVLLSELDTYEEPYSQSLDCRERSEIEFFQDVRSGHLRVTFSGDESRPITRLARECVRVHPHDRPTAAKLFVRLQKIHFDYQESEKERRAMETLE